MRSVFLSLMALVQVAAAVKQEAQWPPAGTAVVKAFAMSGGPSDRIVMDGKIHPTAKPAEGLALTEEQVRRLSAAMNVEQKMRLSMRCFEPRDAVVFYDKDGKIIASVSVCFTCYGARIEPESMEKRLDYGAMADFFASLKLEGGYDFGEEGADAYKVKYRQLQKEVQEKREKKDEAKREAVEKHAVKWPWEGVATVKAFGYDGGKGQPIVKDGRMDPSAEPPEGVRLDARQLELASRAIHHIPAESLPLYMCYEPRDALVFYDKDGGIVGSISICFSCFRTDPMQINFSLMAELFAPLKLRKGHAFKDGEPKAIQEKYDRLAVEKNKIVVPPHGPGEAVKK